MFRRTFTAALPVLLGVAIISVGPGLRADDLHRNGFSGRDAFWVRGDANIHFEEKSHKISDEKARNATTSEYIKIEAKPAPGSTDAEFVHYYYETPRVAITAELVARLWVKGFKPGVQLKARVVLPREKDPRNADAALTTFITGDTYTRVQQWQQLSLGDARDSLRKNLPVLTAKLGRAVDASDAYIDQLVLNVYTAAGISEVWIDDLEVGPVPANQGGEVGEKPGKLGKPLAQVKGRIPSVEFSNGDLLVDNKPFLMRAIRHSDTPLWVLDVARFNTIWFPGEVSNETYEEAVRGKFWLVPTLPLPQADWDPAKPNQGDPAHMQKDADALAAHFRRFLATDAVLMWDFGSGRTTEQIKRVAAVSEAVKKFDPRRPRAIDLWDGYEAYSNYVDAVGAHRWPLFTSLDMNHYRDWLAQRKSLTSPGKLSWTWIQTHLPDWYMKLNMGRADIDRCEEPIGPHPEQIRVLTYLALASGYRGIGFWSDKFLSDQLHGRDRLLEIALLNVEMELLEPVLLNAQEPAKWYPTSHPMVKAAVIRGPKEVVVLPVWLGANDQYCPEQGTVSSLTINVPLVPEGAIPWLISPAGVDEIKDSRRVTAGTEITLREFDTTAAIVFTTDLSEKGKVVRWQDNTRHKLSPTVAHWAREQAVVQYNKALTVHGKILAAGGPNFPEANDLFCEAKKLIDRASLFTDNNQPDLAYREARRALRPIRVLMREHWNKAVEPLDSPSSSPYAVSFFSLPRHWELTKYIQQTRPVGNVLAHGTFELGGPTPPEGAAVSSVPGWLTRKTFLDPVVGIASIVQTDADGIIDPPAERQPYKKDRNFVPGRIVPTAADIIDSLPRPDLGRHCLRLQIRPKPAKEGETKPPVALERSFLAVDSPTAEFAPGSWVRISFWVKIAKPGIVSSADGVLVYDTNGGEPLAIRLLAHDRWKQYHMYRQVPETGKLGLTLALTGMGTVYFDDVRMEPMAPFAVAPSTTKSEQLPKPRATISPSLPELLNKPRPIEGK